MWDWGRVWDGEGLGRGAACGLGCGAGHELGVGCGTGGRPHWHGARHCPVGQKSGYELECGFRYDLMQNQRVCALCEYASKSFSH